MSRRKATPIPSSRYASKRRRRARHTKVRLSMVLGINGGYRNPSERKLDKPITIREWTTRIDKALARIERPPKPATGYLRPVADNRRGVAKRPPTWTYTFLNPAA